jgi:predicted nucleic acid-binding protein
VTGWLLDTNVLSELRRRKPSPKVVTFVVAQPLEQLHISVVNLAEIRYGIESVADIDKRAELNDWLAHKVRPMFEQRVLPVTEDVMFKWRLLVAEGRRVGHIFATRPHHRSVRSCSWTAVVTRDTGDYVRANVPVFDPWTA